LELGSPFSMWAHIQVAQSHLALSKLQDVVHNYPQHM